MKRQRRKYETPKAPWDKNRIEIERKVINDYGLRRKHEIFRTESILRNFRRLARELEANKDPEKQAVLINKVHSMGLIPKSATLDNILALTLENLLDRRLQTIVVKRGIAHTSKQARQFIVHGHIAICGKRNRWPSTVVRLEEEPTVSFYERSKVKLNLSKPAATPAEAKKPEGEMSGSKPA